MRPISPRAQSAVLGALRADPMRNRVEIAAATGLHPRTVTAAIQALRAAGRIGTDNRETPTPTALLDAALEYCARAGLPFVAVVQTAGDRPTLQMWAHETACCEGMREAIEALVPARPGEDLLVRRG